MSNSLTDLLANLLTDQLKKWRTSDPTNRLAIQLTDQLIVWQPNYPTDWPQNKRIQNYYLPQEDERVEEEMCGVGCVGVQVATKLGGGSVRPQPVVLGNPAGVWAGRTVRLAIFAATRAKFFPGCLQLPAVTAPDKLLIIYSINQNQHAYRIFD